MLRTQGMRRRALASAVALACATPVIGSDVTIAAGTSSDTSQSVGGTDHIVVGAGATWAVDDTVIKWKDPSTALIIDNAGLVESTEEGGRAINASGDGTGTRYLTLNNAAGATIESQSDAFRINTDFSDGQVVVNNAGTIRSTVDGQALDFDTVSSTGTATASITINNLAGGLIQADGADAIRPGQGGTVNNAGTIYADGVIGDSNDGIDFQAHSGTVVNLPGGLISGQRHGITSDTDVNVYNAAGATIIGRNGSGVGSDGTGKVVNYGTITGAYVGTGNGDGDGVDIDLYGEVDNWGVIEGTGAGGTDKSGAENGSEGVVITQGGIISNHQGGIIRGVFDGVTAFGTFSITNEGEIEGGSVGMYLTGDSTLTNTGAIQSGNEAITYGAGSLATVINSGVISGGTYAIHFADGNDTLVIDAGSAITGIVDGGAGEDTLQLRGGSFGAAQNFEYLHVTGSAALTGDNSFENVLIEGSLRVGDGGTSGSVGNATIVDNGTLQLDRSDAVTLANAISGTGGFEQVGTGTTTLTGANTYTGPTAVIAGTLVIGEAGAGSVSGDAAIAAGATLRGSGNIGGQLVVQGGAILAPGTASTIGTLTVGGDVTLADGATYRIDAAGDALTSEGRVSIGAATSLLVSSETALQINTPYTVVTAASGLSGTFASTTVAGVTSAFLTPTTSYTSQAVSLTLVRNDVALSTVAQTHDERTTATAIDSLPVTAPLAASVLMLDTSGAKQAIGELAGEQFASTRTAMIDNAQAMRDAVTRHLMGEDRDGRQGQSAERNGITAWTAAFGHDGSNSRGNAARLTTQGGGLLVGADVATGDARIGAVAGRGIDNDDVDARNSSARVRSTHLGFYGDIAWDAWRLRGGASYAWQDVDTTRHLTTVAAGTRLTTHYDAGVAQAFIEGGYRLEAGDRQWLEPFASVARVRLRTDAASEGSAVGALDVDAGATSVNNVSIGLRNGVELGGRLQAHGSLAWTHATGDLDSASRQRFAGMTSDFSVRGTPIARQAAAVGVGLTYDLSSRTSLDASYNGQFASHARDQGARLQLTVQL